MSAQARERYWPYAAGLLGIAAAGVAVKLDGLLTTDSLHDLLGGVLTFGTVIVGFLSTVLALLYAVPSQGSVAFVATAGGIGLLVRILVVDINFWLIFLALSFGLDFGRGAIDAAGLLGPATAVWAYVPTAGFLALYRAVRLIGKFLLLASSTPPAQPASAAATGER